jgi:hypothetical protein
MYMKIRIVGHEGQPNFPFGEDGPWRDFANEIESAGHQIVTSDYGVKIDALIANSHNESAIREANKAEVALSRRFLIIWEPRVVDNFPYTKRSCEAYGFLYSPSVMWATKLNSNNFNWPQSELYGVDHSDFAWNRRINRAVLIQANKFSVTRNEQYSLRRKLLVLNEKTHKTIDLYGYSWNISRIYDFKKTAIAFLRTPKYLFSPHSLKKLGHKYISYKGPVDNKFKLINSYRLAIVIENSPDYVSEKLFDAIIGGAIAIYVGPSLITFGIPNDAAIQIKNEASLINEKIGEILNMPFSEQIEIAKNQRKLIVSVYDEWNNRRVLKNLAHEIVYKLEKNPL